MNKFSHDVEYTRAFDYTLHDSNSKKIQITVISLMTAKVPNPSPSHIPLLLFTTCPTGKA